MKVRYLAGDTDAAGHYRCLFPAHYLNQHGHDASEPPYTDHEGPGGYVQTIRAYDLERMEAGVDLIVLHQSLEKHWAFLQVRQDGRDVPVAYDCDDAVWCVPHWNEAWKGLMGPNARVTPKTLPHILRRCELATASTPFIADHMSLYCGNVHLIRNRLHWPMWENAPLSCDTDRGDEVRVGYVGAFDWRKGDLDVLGGALDKILRKHRNVKFVSAGTDGERLHDYLRIPKDQRVTVPYKGFGAHHMSLWQMLDFDIGLIPLRLVPFNEGKSHLKGMDYNARGIPFIASPSESYKHYTVEGVNGFLARKPKEWAKLLSALIEDEELRRNMGSLGRETAERHKMEDHIGEWETAYESI